MKKIIAAALSILVGTFGFTIVDKELIERVDNLEYSVSSMQEQIDQMETPTNKTTEGDITIPTTGTTQDSQPLEVDDIIPVSENQMKKFLIEWDGYSSNYIRPQTNGNIAYTTSSNNKNAVEYFIYVDSFSARVNNVYDDTSSYYDSDYTVCTKIYKTYTIDVSIKGHTSEKLAGNRIMFLSVNLSDIYSDYKTPYATINSDGSFEINLSINSSKINSSTTISFNCPEVSLPYIIH